MTSARTFRNLKAKKNSPGNVTALLLVFLLTIAWYIGILGLGKYENLTR
ncbi:hypothetical protein [Paraherbaspirillum soli]|uniref:Uncharacterized protein n=1 Tax=Paraherbaspirillum soli TaxID=631222 RepID=A0ABW0M989_9BURK